jgi:DNA replication licensing factor MCM6
MPIRGEGLVSMTDGDEAEEQAHKVVYVLHPNCAVEEM